MRLVVSENF